jgi:hypothetical protein
MVMMMAMGIQMPNTMRRRRRTANRAKRASMSPLSIETKRCHARGTYLGVHLQGYLVRK